MIKVQKIFFCDNIEIGLFNKRNFIGAILAKEVELAAIPYNFITYLIILGETTENCEIVLEISHGKNMFAKIPIKIELGKSGIINGIVEPVKLTLNIQKVGELEFKLFESTKLLFSDTFNFLMGTSPFTNQKEHLPNSGILNKQEDFTFVKKIISLATTSIVLIDNYIKNSFELRKLIGNIIDINIEILVFVNSSYKKGIESDLDLFVDYPNLKLFYKTPGQELGFHDRYIIVDTTEYYNFGASLNDISKEKISGFKKITAKEEIEILKEVILKLIEG